MIFSKCLNLGLRAPVETPFLLRLPPTYVRKPKKFQLIDKRRSSSWLPPNQYDSPWSRRMVFGTVIRDNWEVIPLFVVTGISISILLIAIIWAIQNKVDVTYAEHNYRESISRSMNLLYPSCHKMLTITQEYIPWPEMQEIQVKLVVAEKRWRAREEAEAAANKTAPPK